MNFIPQNEFEKKCWIFPCRNYGLFALENTKKATNASFLPFLNLPKVESCKRKDISFFRFALFLLLISGRNHRVKRIKSRKQNTEREMNDKKLLKYFIFTVLIDRSTE